jgi:hypothetical protein
MLVGGPGGCILAAISAARFANATLAASQNRGRWLQEGPITSIIASSIGLSQPSSLEPEEKGHRLARVDTFVDLTILLDMLNADGDQPIPDYILPNHAAILCQGLK